QPTAGRAAGGGRMAVIMAEGLLLCLLAAVPASAREAAMEDGPDGFRVQFLAGPASGDVRRLVDWVAESGDNRSLPFAIVDKVDARVFVFDAHGMLLGVSPVLLGLARGDVAP